MNNYAEITLVPEKKEDGKKVIPAVKQGLTFGMAAAEEFYKLITAEDADNVNGTMQTANVIYAGACNEALINRKPRPDYRTIYEWVEAAYEDEQGDLIKELSTAIEVFNESRFKKNLDKTTEVHKKKSRKPAKVDFDKIKQFAYGRLSLKPLEYYALPPIEFDIMVLAITERDKYAEKLQLMNTRLVCWMIYQANADPKKAAKTIDEFMPLDGKKQLSKPSQKQIQSWKKKLEEKLNKKQNG